MTILSDIDRTRALGLLELLRARGLNGKKYSTQDELTAEGKKKVPETTKRSIQEMIHWLSDNKYPIGSGTKGHYYVAHSDDWKETISWQHSRIQEQINRLKKTLEQRDDMYKAEHSMFETAEQFPSLKKLIEEFEAVKV